MIARAVPHDRDPSALAGLLALLRERTGLEIPANRWAACEAAVRRAMSATSARDIDAYRAALHTDDDAFAALVEELTIGETYFFRDPRQFAFLRDEAVPDVRRRRAPGHVLSAWSAGCASGEEAYSLAILLRELGLGERRRIVGTDISRRRLDAARRARYGKWSLRGVAPEVIDRYFRRSGPSFELIPAIRSAVRFQYLNLAGEGGPEAPAGGFDLIVCRNVLIYLDAVTVGRVAHRLVEQLADGGWLLLGPSDPPPRNTLPCDVVMTDAGLAYRRQARGARAASYRTPWRAAPREPLPGAGASAESRVPTAGDLRPRAESSAPEKASPPPAPPLDDALAQARRAYAACDYAPAAAHARQYVHGGGNDVDGWAVLVRALANGGQSSAAALACAAALEAHPASAELAVLQSFLLTELSQPYAAMVAARRAVYLDRGLAVAHLAFGSALVRAGEAQAARRAFANALRLLDPMPAAAIVPASGGESAARLAVLARSQLQLLREDAP